MKKITVILRNKTPLHSSAPGVSKITLDGRIGDANGFPLIRTRTMPLPAPRGEGVMTMVPVPLIPNNTMRNALRRAMLDSVFNQLRGRASISVGAYAGANSGNASGNPEGVPATFDETMAIRNHVFLGLFGGGPRMIEGRLKVDALYPIHPDALRTIGDGYEERMISGKLTDVVWQRRVDPISQAADESVAELITGGAESLTAWAVNSLEQSRRAADKRNKGGKKGAKAEEGAEEAEEDGGRGLKAFNAHEVVVPGIDWLWRIKMENPTKAQVGLVLQGINRIGDVQIGGGHAKSYGEVEIQDVLLDGESIWDGSSLASESAEDYFDALAEALDGLKAADFENFVQSSKDGE
ncbi:type IV CRISPR-associated protein Csf2 [Geopseudomonas aromaticivorans]